MSVASSVALAGASSNSIKRDIIKGCYMRVRGQNETGAQLLHDLLLPLKIHSKRATNKLTIHGSYP